MDERTVLVDTLDTALHYTRFDLRLGAQLRHQRQIFLEYLAGVIRRRLDEGRSMDCEEWRSLKKFAVRSNYEA